MEDVTVRQALRAYEALFGEQFQGLRLGDAADAVVKKLGKAKGWKFMASQSNEDRPEVES